MLFDLPQLADDEIQLLCEEHLTRLQAARHTRPLRNACRCRRRLVHDLCDELASLEAELAWRRTLTG